MIVQNKCHKKMQAYTVVKVILPGERTYYCTVYTVQCATVSAVLSYVLYVVHQYLCAPSYCCTYRVYSRSLRGTAVLYRRYHMIVPPVHSTYVTAISVATQLWEWKYRVPPGPSALGPCDAKKHTHSRTRADPSRTLFKSKRRIYFFD